MKPLLCLAALQLAAPALAQADVERPAPCTAPEAAGLDFWTGTWALTWEPGATGDGETGRGTNTITRTLGGCVVEERFAAESGFDGLSVSVYQPRTGQWRQTWVDNQGGYLLLTGGPTPDGRMELRTAPFPNAQGQEQVNRMTWDDVTPDALTWRWQRSLDGGASWEDLWVIRYARAAPDPPADATGAAGWLEGAWQTEAFDGSIYEEWRARPDGALAQRGRYVEDGDTTYTETTAITDIDGRRYLIAVPSNGPPQVYAAVRLTPAELVFENASYENPYRITYARGDGASFTRTLVGRAGGREQTNVLRFRRRPNASAGDPAGE